MKIESKLSFNDMKKNIKRTIFTTISIILCAFLILTTLLTISSIRNGRKEETNKKYIDYHFIIKNIDAESFELIKNKPYIDKIYIQYKDDEPLEELNKNMHPFENINTINLYIKYTDIKKTYEYSSNVLQTLGFSITKAQNDCKFNEKLLIVYGLMKTELDYTDASQTTIMYKDVLNFSYVINIMIILILAVFSVLFIVILYNAFLVAINERRKEYAILNSIGATEGQILKMIFEEATIMAIIGFIIGMLISIFGTHVILNMLNTILVPTDFYFNLVIDIKYIILAFVIILFNIYISAMIPSIKASNTSIIQNIRNNQQIKYKKSHNILRKILPIEGRLALINLKRNKNKYRIVTILFVICMTSYITVTTYINYEKEAAALVSNHDVDAELVFYPDKANCKLLIDNYAKQSGDKIEYIEYKTMGLYSLVEPIDSIINDNYIYTVENNKRLIPIELVGLEEKEYNTYINKINAHYGDGIIYNNFLASETSYIYETRFKSSENLKFTIIDNTYNFEKNMPDCKIIDDENLQDNFVLTNEILEGFQEYKTEYGHSATIFINMDTYNKIEKKVKDYITPDNIASVFWLHNRDAENNFPTYLKVKCGNIISFSHYIEERKNPDFFAYYYSLDNQEKLIYLDILQLILRSIVTVILIIGSVSAINIINASIYERKREFEILFDIGATKENINKILIYECIYMFIKASMISVILSIPIIYIIIKQMENIMVLNRLLIPFEHISIFFVLLFVLSIFITLCSMKSIKNIILSYNKKSFE